MDTTNSLAHTKWECKYHMVFAPKYRRRAIYKDICSDHIHMLVRIPPKYSVSEIVGYLKGKSSLMIFEKQANLKYKYGNRHFWCRVLCRYSGYKPEIIKQDFHSAVFLSNLSALIKNMADTHLKSNVQSRHKYQVNRNFIIRRIKRNIISFIKIFP